MERMAQRGLQENSDVAQKKIQLRLEKKIKQFKTKQQWKRQWKHIGLNYLTKTFMI